MTSHFCCSKIGNTPATSLSMSTENETLQVLLPCTINLLRCQATQLRNGLVKASEQQCRANPETDCSANQLKLALKAVEEALSILKDCEISHEIPKKEEGQEQKNGKPLTIFERANCFQSWDASRRQEKQGSQQRQMAVKRKLSE